MPTDAAVSMCAIGLVLVCRCEYTNHYSSHYTIDRAVRVAVGSWGERKGGPVRHWGAGCGGSGTMVAEESARVHPTRSQNSGGYCGTNPLHTPNTGQTPLDDRFFIM